MMRVLFLVILFHCSYGFLPSQESGNPDDYSHQSITETAIYETAAIFIQRYVNAGTSVNRYASRTAINVTKEFIRGDRETEALFGRVVETIVWGNNNAQRMYRNVAMRTMNAELILVGNLLLQSIRDQVLVLSQSSSPDWNNIRKLIGEYLFTMQMFYSNTNWVETFGNVSCKELGIRGHQLMQTAPASVDTCAGCDYSHSQLEKHSCAQNILTNGQYLTSGYLSYQSIPKPPGNASEGIGKCSHGGKNDAYQSVNAIGGINKETSNPSLSPHFFLHQAAGEAAIAATIDFFVGEVTGILDQIGPRLFGELIGLPVACQNCLQSDLSLAYVIDTSLSMSTEFSQIKLKIKDTIMAAMMDAKSTPADYILSTFSDPLSLNTIRNTTDGHEMVKWFDLLQQEGGGDCPEYSFHGLLEALKIIRPGSCLFFYSDADPKDPELEQIVVQLAMQKRIHIAFLIRGSCNTGIPFMDRLENSTKATCLKQTLKPRRKRREISSIRIHEPWKKLLSFHEKKDQYWLASEQILQFGVCIIAIISVSFAIIYVKKTSSIYQIFVRKTNKPM